jgi:hypothetical protein
MVTFLTAGNLHEKQAAGKCIAKGLGGIDNRAISHRSNPADKLAREAAVSPPPDRILKLGRHRKNDAWGGRADEPDGGSDWPSNSSSFFAANTMCELRFVVVALTGIQRREPVQTIIVVHAIVMIVTGVASPASARVQSMRRTRDAPNHGCS